MRAPAPGVAARRVAWVRALFLIGFAGLALRAVHLTLIDPRGASRGESQTRKLLHLAPERGDIQDRSGAALALSVPAPSVYAIPAELRDVADTARRLAPVLGLDRAALERRLGHSRFVFLARWVSPERARRVEALGLPGIGILEEPRRDYPHGGLAGTVLGFANIDGVGVRGIEQQEDGWLRGVPRRVPVERDARGRLLVTAGDGRWETTGGAVALTLDAALQAQAEAALARAVARTGAQGGVLISMDPRSGEIWALAEAPVFDPNRFRETPYEQTRSRAFLDAWEPGSVLKPFHIAGALDAGVLRADQAVDCEGGRLRVPGKTIRDRDPHGALSAAEILRVSSNVGAVKIAFALGRGAHHDWLRRFGFGERSGSGFPDESAGLLRPAAEWRELDHAAIAFGQGLNATPVQIAAALAVLANGGELVRPRLVGARRAPRGRWIPAAPGRRRRVLRPETAARVLAMLEGVVSQAGTGARAGLAGLRVAGKTGTAQKWDPEAGRYARDRFAAWFAGVVPADAPRLVVVAMLDEPRRPHHTGGAAAAPLFAEVAAAQLGRLGIATAPSVATAPIARVAPPRPDPARPSRTEPLAARPELPRLAKLGARVLLPDLRGLSLEEVIEVTEREAISVEIVGRGLAVAQEPSPGTILSGPSVVRVRFASPQLGPGPGGES